jgi:hypothetical protein
MFVDEIKNIVVEKMTAEEALITELKQYIVRWAKTGREEADLSAYSLERDFLNTGFIESNSFDNVMKGIDFAMNFFIKEGFKVETFYKSFPHKDLHIIITWGKN